MCLLCNDCHIGCKQRCDPCCVSKWSTPQCKGKSHSCMTTIDAPFTFRLNPVFSDLGWTWTLRVISRYHCARSYDPHSTLPTLEAVCKTLCRVCEPCTLVSSNDHCFLRRLGDLLEEVYEGLGSGTVTRLQCLTGELGDSA
jgi:hypothetical protein